MISWHAEARLPASKVSGRRTNTSSTTLTFTLTFTLTLTRTRRVASRVHVHARPTADEVYSLTYSYSNGSPLIPDLGLPSQFAILPGSVTGCISERT